MLHTLNAALLAADDDGLQELVRLAFLISLLHGLHWVGALFALAENETLQGRSLVPLPPLDHDPWRSSDRPRWRSSPAPISLAVERSSSM